MKKDMQIVMAILMQIEVNGNCRLCGRPAELLSYHKKFLFDSNFVSGALKVDHEGLFEIEKPELTEKGRQFLSTLKLAM